VRTCLALGCPDGKKCSPLGLGYHECVAVSDSTDCHITPCDGDLECVANPRGPQFPSVCAVPAAPTTPLPVAPSPAVTPKPAVITSAINKEPSSDDWPLWLIIVIAVVALILCIVVCVVIGALIVCLTRDSGDAYGQDPFAASGNYDPYANGGSTQMNSFGTNWDAETQELRRGNPMCKCSG
jgi:hypothetical protein